MKYIVIILFFILFTSCSSIRFDYGFNFRNRTKKEPTTLLYFDNGNVKMKKKIKFISVHNTIDGAVYIKTRIKWYYDDGRIRADTLIEEVTSVWGYLNMKGVYKLYSINGKEKKINKEWRKQSNW